MPNSLRPHGLQPTRLHCPWDFPGKDTGVGCHFLLLGIFLTQGSNPGLLHCRHILYWLSYEGSPSTINLYAAAAAKSLQSCPTLCDPIDGSPPGSPIPGILQARILGWVAISFSNAWNWKVKVKSLSRARLLASPWTAAHRLLRPWDFPGKSTGVGCHRLRRLICISNTKRRFRNIYSRL